MRVQSGTDGGDHLAPVCRAEVCCQEKDLVRVAEGESSLIKFTGVLAQVDDDADALIFAQLLCQFLPADPVAVADPPGHCGTFQRGVKFGMVWQNFPGRPLLQGMNGRKIRLRRGGKQHGTPVRPGQLPRRVDGEPRQLRRQGL